MSDDHEGRSEEFLAELQAARDEAARLRTENDRLRALLGLEPPAAAAEAPVQYALFAGAAALPSVDASSSFSDRIAVYRSLFRGREDVYAVHWTSTRSEKSGYSPAVKGGWHGRDARTKEYLPLTDEVIEQHLLGAQTVGLYPLLKDDTCWFLACDLDGPSWMLDTLDYLEVCRTRGVPAYLERSRSGGGGHVWTFFSTPVEATLARRLGMGLIRETMLLRAEMDLASYDRLFPSQDFVPRGSFGNLIALPLQGSSRERGNMVFLDPSTLEPWADQWDFLSSIRRLSPAEVERAAKSVRSVAVGSEAASSVRLPARGERRPPPSVSVTLASRVSLERSGLPPSLLSSIKHLASLHNPEFHKRQKLRLSTYQTPRFIRCYEEDLTHIHLPRGTLAELEETLRRAGSAAHITDNRIEPSARRVKFAGRLNDSQTQAVDTLLQHDFGVLVAPPGTGKTVMGCALIGARSVPTLVLVHREPLVEQWHRRLVENLGLSSDEIGIIGGGKDRRTGIDIAMIQSLRTIEDLESFFSTYGLLMIDECHHIPAVSFEACVKRAPVKFIVGLTATPYRKDGLEGIITMQCGPVRHELARDLTDGIHLHSELRIRATETIFEGAEDASIQEVFRALVDDSARTKTIVADVRDAVRSQRRCLVLSQWKKHVRAIAESLRNEGIEPIVLEGGRGKKARDAISASLHDLSPDDDLVIVATGQYIGEGFDCPQLDTLFLTFPIAFKGSLVQYTGRLMRPYAGKMAVIVYDYADTSIPVLRKMLGKRLKSYRALGFSLPSST